MLYKFQITFIFEVNSGEVTSGPQQISVKAENYAEAGKLAWDKIKELQQVCMRSGDFRRVSTAEFKCIAEPIANPTWDCGLCLRGREHTNLDHYNQLHGAN